MKDTTEQDEPASLTLGEWFSGVALFHAIAIASFLFGCLIGRLALKAGASFLVAIGWPIALTVLAYGASILVVGFAGGRRGDVKKMFTALFMPWVFVRK